jgi:hypothetical protein
MNDDALECLGEVTCGSGTLIVVDPGLLNLWSHDRPPVIPLGILEDSTTDSANRGVDFHIDGPDAEAAGRAFGHGWHPRYIYDIPAHGLDALRGKFEALVAERGLRAHLVPVEGRVRHRQRVDDVLRRAPAGEVSFHGLRAPVISGIPRGPMRILGRRMPDGEHQDMWQEVWLDCLPEANVASTEHFGTVSVDWARVMFADVEALGSWQHDDPLDGLADVVFWGLDASRAAQALSAPALGEGQYGWTDLPIEAAVERGEAVEDFLHAGGVKFAMDFRPHSHHHEILRQIRSTPTQSGVLDVAGQRLCAFFTTWGDGFYPVHRDLTAHGNVARVRVLLEFTET